MVMTFVPGVRKPKRNGDDTLWFAFQNGNLVVFEDGDGIMVPQTASFETVRIPFQSHHYLGQYLQQDCFAVDVPSDVSLPSNYKALNLYELLGEEDDTLFHLAGRAKQIVEWDHNHQFCSRCGKSTNDHPEDRAKQCPECGYLSYPRLSPSIIVLITRGEEILLARSANFPPRLFSTLAGFVEVGESVEECVKREVFEEVGIQIKNERYHSSQPWPFPHSLMIGFHAEYDSGEICIDEKEIVDARWWHVDSLPNIPPKGSISRLLIDSYLQKVRPNGRSW